MSKTFERQSSFGWLVNALASQAAKRLDGELKKHGLTIALWPTMMCLWEEEGVTQREISEKSKVENSTTTRTLDKLEKLELVVRRADPNSRRSYQIFLTDKGRSLKEILLPIPLALNKQTLNPLEQDEQQELIRLLQKVLSNL